MTTSEQATGIERLGLVLGLAAAIAGLATTGCASSSTTSSEPPPYEAALNASQKRVEGGVAEAANRADASGPFLLSARFNPPRCGAPEFEVFAHGAWRRVFVVGSRSVRSELETIRETLRNESEFRILRIQGRFQGKRRAENGLKYPVFRVATIESRRENSQVPSDERSSPLSP